MPTRPACQGILLSSCGLGTDVKRRLPTVVQPSDYYPLVTFQLGSDEVLMGSLRVMSVFRCGVTGRTSESLTIGYFTRQSVCNR